MKYINRLWAAKSRIRAIRSSDSRTPKLAIRRLAAETLESRQMLAADLASCCLTEAEPKEFGLPHIVWAPDTSPELVARYEAEFGHRHDDHAHEEANGDYRVGEFNFTDGDRWSGTATNGFGLNQGQPTTLTWSIVPDGTSVHGYVGEPTADSDLVSWLDGIYGSGPGGSDYSQRPWFSVVQSAFDRWEELSGIDYVYEPNDDGAAMTQNSLPSGNLGVRGDVRLAGHFIDGNSGTLAYNFFPNAGDMVIDTADSFYNNTNNNSRRLRNVMAHEIGHGLGLEHVEPVNQTKLMEPFISLAYDGPQFDDILAIHRGYGDVYEVAGGNNTAATATPLGTIAAGQTISIGGDATDSSILSTDVDFVSIDDNSDLDYFSFDVLASVSASITLSPLGPTYQSNPNTFVASEQSNLSFNLIDSDGSSIIASANAAGLGEDETLVDIELPGAGTYLVRVSGTANAAQFFQLDVSITEEIQPSVPPLNFNDFTIKTFGGPNQDITGPVTVENGGQTLHMVGNRWKRIDLPYNITPDTVLEFDFSSTAEGEIHGIGFSTDLKVDSAEIFKVFGGQNWGISDFDNYTLAAGTQRYIIPIGQYYTGQMNYLVFANDHDIANPTGESIFSNVTIYDDVPGGQPPTALDDFFTAEQSMTTTLDVLANDSTFPDAGEILSITAVGPGSAGGLIEINPGAHSINYTPAVGFSGNETFTYTINDGTPGSDDTATVTVTVSDNSQPTIDFNSFTIRSYGGSSQDLTGPVTVEDEGQTLHITGNRWKKIDFPYEITTTTVIEFDFRSTSEGEIHGIGFTSSNRVDQPHTFQLFGGQTWGIQAFNDYQITAGTKHYVIPVGQFYTGEFTSLIFANDHDVSAPNAESFFTNVAVYETSAPNASLRLVSTSIGEDVLPQATNRSSPLYFWQQLRPTSLAETFGPIQNGPITDFSDRMTLYHAIAESVVDETVHPSSEINPVVSLTDEIFSEHEALQCRLGDSSLAELIFAKHRWV